MRFNRDAYWYQMFGADAIQPLQKDPPALPLDDEMWWAVQTVTGGNAAQRIEDDAFVKAVSGCDSATSPEVHGSQKMESAGAGFELAKRNNPGPSRKKIINDRLDAKLYRHDLRERWNSMLEKFAAEGADALPDAVLLRKASAYLGI